MNAEALLTDEQRQYLDGFLRAVAARNCGAAGGPLDMRDEIRANAADFLYEDELTAWHRDGLLARFVADVY